jgi:hypothetical protein
MLLLLGCLPADETSTPTVDSSRTLEAYPGILIIEGDATEIIDFCEKYDRVDGSLVIEESALTSLTALACLVEIQGDLRVNRNDDLTTLAELRSLAYVSGTVLLEENANLDLAGALPALNETGGMYFSSLPGTTTLGEFPALERVDGNVELLDLPVLSGFSALREIDGDLVVMRSAAMELSGLTRLELAGSVVVKDNYALTQLGGLSSLTKVEGDVFISGSAIESVAGLTALSSVGSLSLFQTGLSDVNGLVGIRTVDGTLSMVYNPVLANLDGLHGTGSIGGSLEIKGNPKLNPVEIAALVEAIGLENIEGGVDTASDCFAGCE